MKTHKILFVVMHITGVQDTIKIMKKSPQHFDRFVIGCTNSYNSEKRRILEDFSRSDTIYIPFAPLR